MGPKKSEPVKVKSFQCPKCGAPIELRAPHAIHTVICASCNSALDAKNPDFAVLRQYSQKIKYRPLIPLGAKGRLKGEIFQCIGFMRRRTTVEGINYDWSEYLLYNPYKGFRWLVESQGHWTSVKPASSTPKQVWTPGSPQADFEVFGSTYKHFQTVTAKVIFVIGEFYWQVKVGETVECADYVCPPHILSREKSEGEVTWSIGDYTTGQDVWTAFKLPGNPPPLTGVAAAQPSPLLDEVQLVGHWMWTFVLIACVIQIAFVLISADEQVLRQSFQYSNTQTEKSKVSNFFELKGRASNLVIQTDADVDNHYVYNSYALINETTQQALDFGREVEYYHGSDYDGPWTEGSRTDTATISSVSAGRYFLRIEPQSDAPVVNYTVTVRRDVTALWPLIVALVLLVLPPCFLKYRQWSFEVERWKESDHPLIVSGEGSDD